MNLKQRIFRNSSLEMASKIVGIVAGIFLSPFLIRRLSTETYGLWVLIGSVVGYFGFTDFGVRAATARQVAFHRGRGDSAMVNKTINTSLLLLAASGFVVTVITAVLAPLFAKAFHIDPSTPNVASAVFACGFAVAVGLPLTVFEGCLAGYERYDLINLCEIVTTAGRVGLTVWLLEKGWGLLALASINLGLTIANGFLKLVLSKWVFKPLHVAPRNFERSLVRETYATSIWFLILAISVRISFFTDNIVIGYFLGTTFVAIYSIAGRLAQYALVAVHAFNLVLMPIAAGFEAKADLTNQRRLLLLGTRASFAAAVFMATIFLAYGGQIIHVWVGSGFEKGATVLTILTIPMITSASQMTTLSVLQGMAKHKPLSFIYLTEALANLILSLILVKPMGMIGVALGTALTSTFSSLIAQPIYVSRVLSLGLGNYYRKAFLPVLLGTAPLVALIAGVRYVWLPQHFLSMAVFCIAAAAFYFGAVYLMFFTKRSLALVSFGEEASHSLRKEPHAPAAAHRSSSSTLTPLRFVCPHCLGNLMETSDALNCRACNEVFPLSHGIPDLSAKSDYYYGEFPQEMMRSIIEIAIRDGSARAFETALQDKTDDWRRYFLHYATDETRAAWQFLLHLPKNASALDMGCGWGNLSISLAHNFTTVYAMDLVWERAVITSIRAREVGLQNVHALVGGNTTRLPFPDASLDAVTLNGVLEWVATSFPNVNNPREAQLHVLREIARVLKPEGQVYIGIENRLGFLYFLGRPDEHSKLKFTTLMPRWLADRYSMVKRNQRYRTYTYSWRGYRKLLREAGLADARFYCPFPEYREFSELISLDHPRNLALALHPTSFIGRIGMQVCRRVNVFREFSPSYSIVASKSFGANRFIDRLFRQIGIASPDGLCLRVTRTAAVLLLTPEVVIRLPLTARAERRMRAEAANLKLLGLSQRPSVPKLIAEGELQGQAYLVTPCFPGVSGMKLLHDPRKLALAVSQAVDFATRLHRNTRIEHVCTQEWLQKHFDWLVDSVSALGANVSDLKTLCRRDLLGKRVATVTAHGDFSLQNLIFDPITTKLTGVVDWDLAEQAGWPVRDVIHLLVALEYEKKNATLNEAAITVLKRLRDSAGPERELLRAYLIALSVEPEQIVWAIQVYLLRSIHDKHEFGDKKTAPLLKHLTAELAAARQATRKWLDPDTAKNEEHLDPLTAS